MRSILLLDGHAELKARISAWCGDRVRLYTAKSVREGFELLERHRDVQVLVGRFTRWDAEDRDRAYHQYKHLPRVEIAEDAWITGAADRTHHGKCICVITPSISEIELSKMLHTAFTVYDLIQDVRGDKDKQSQCDFLDGKYSPSQPALNSLTGQPPDENNPFEDEYLVMAAHDVRAPLSVIVGYANILQDTETQLSENGKRVVKRMRDTSERLLDIVSKILRQSVVANGKSLLEMEQCKLSTIGHEVLEDLKELAQKKGQNLAMMVDGDQNSYLLDKLAIIQVLYNLLTNSIKFTNHGGNIALSIKGTPKLVTFSVTDNGIGMTAKQVEQVLADSPIESASHQLPGSHLGLSIVNRIVKLHKGEIQVESVFGQGTIFTFTVTPG